jgi:RNA polymerase sigma-70 factor (ECF subfamily)
VLAYVIRETRDRELAADLTAEVFAAVLISAARYRADGASAMPWVIGIARNKLRMSFRRGSVEARARRTLGFEALALEDDDLVAIEALADSAGGPAGELFAQLPEEERRAVRARVIEERPYGEIAAELGCSEMVVRKRVSRGLARLRERIGER